VALSRQASIGTIFVAGWNSGPIIHESPSDVMSRTGTYMNCDDFQPLISASLDDEISDEEMQLLGSHFQQCADCRRRSKSYRQISGLVRSTDLWRWLSEEEFERVSKAYPSKQMVYSSQLENRAGRASHRWFWSGAGLTAAALVLLAWSLTNWTWQRRELAPSYAEVDILSPLVSLAEINSERIRDQELFRESLELDLRALKLRVYSLDKPDTVATKRIMGKIDQLLVRIDKVRFSENELN
jgi:hypothetical protein